MSLLGSLNDWLTGNPPGTADATSAAGDAASAQSQQINQDNLASGLITQAQYDQTQDDFASQAPDPNSVAAGADELGGAIEGAAQAAENPGQVLATGLQWEGQVAGSALGAAANAASGGFTAALKKFFGSITLTTWIILIVVVALYLYFGGITRRAKRIFG